MFYTEKNCAFRDENPTGSFLQRVPVIDKNSFRPTGVGALIKMHNLYLSLEPGSAFRFLGLFPTTAGPDYPCMTDAVYFSKAFWSKSYLTQNVTHQRATSKLLFWWMLKQMQKSFLPKRRLGTSINSKFLSSYTNYRQEITLHAASKPKLNPLFSFCLFLFSSIRHFQILAQFFPPGPFTPFRDKGKLN